MVKSTNKRNLPTTNTSDRPRRSSAVTSIYNWNADKSPPPPPADDEISESLASLCLSDSESAVSLYNWSLSGSESAVSCSKSPALSAKTRQDNSDPPPLVVANNGGSQSHSSGISLSSSSTSTTSMAPKPTYKDKYNACMKELRNSKLQVASLEQDYTKLEKEHDDLKKVHQEYVGKNKELEAMYNKKLAYIKRLENTKGKKTVMEAKTCKDIVAQVTEITKTAIFRTIKFAKNDAHLAEITAKVIPYLTCDLDITPQEDWITAYSATVKETLSEQRGYVQAELKKRSFGTSDSLFFIDLFCGNLPRILFASPQNTF